LTAATPTITPTRTYEAVEPSEELIAFERVELCDEPDPLGATNVRIIARIGEATLRRKNYGPGFVELHCDCEDCCGPRGQAHFVNGVGHLCVHVAVYKAYL